MNGAGERDPSLDVERDALVSLAAWTPEREKRFQIVSLSMALAGLADVTRRRDRRSSRLLVLERLVRAASRLGPQELMGAENAEGTRDLLDAVLVEAGVDDPSGLESGIELLERALFEVQGLPPAEAYRRFAELATETLSLRTHEVFAPTCNDMETQHVDGHVARVITAEFFSKLPFDRFAPWLDPKSWPALCPWFFRRMDGIPPPHVAPPWVQWYDETVEITAGVRWTTRLRFNHKKRTAPPELRTDYRLRLPNEPDPLQPEPERHLLVDKGFLGAEEFTGQQPGFISRLTMVKIAKFADDELDEWTTLMCDTFWLTLAIEMANAAAEAADPDDPDDNR